jgi:hypothetical protein
LSWLGIGDFKIALQPGPRFGVLKRSPLGFYAFEAALWRLRPCRVVDHRVHRRRMLLALLSASIAAHYSRSLLLVRDRYGFLLFVCNRYTFLEETLGVTVEQIAANHKHRAATFGGIDLFDT